MTTLVEHEHCVFVGDYAYDLPISPGPTVNPVYFYDVANSTRFGHYSNNTCYIRFFPHHKVYCLRRVDGRVLVAPLISHPEYKRLKEIGFDSGELYSLVGNAWVGESADDNKLIALDYHDFGPLLTMDVYMMPSCGEPEHYYDVQFPGRKCASA